jgi:hypothetical protein
MGLSVLMGVGFVARSENRRLTDLDEKNPEPSIPQSGVNLTSVEKLLPQDISRNKKVVLQHTLLFTDFQKLPDRFHRLVEAQTNDFFDLAKIAGLDPLKDFVGADLSFVNLRGINLSYANLSNAFLNRANLRDANLSSTVLSHAILNHANLYEADLSHANLNYADMKGAILYGANLSCAKLDSARVEGSRFGWNKGLTEDLKRDLQQRGAIFEDSTGDSAQILTPI